MKRADSSLPSSIADLATLGQLLEEHRPKLLAMLQRRLDPALAPRLDAEDILSQAFLEARRKWTRFKAQTALSPKAWLYRIARDCLIEAWRKESRDCRDPKREMPWPERSSMQMVMGLVSPRSSPSAKLAQADLRQKMTEALNLLKDKDREVLWMRHHDDLSFQEIGEVLGATENAATLRYVRALNRLRDLWKQLHPHDDL
jgi:RNA polymerase sigma-70 factor (ECF subfamily)